MDKIKDFFLNKLVGRIIVRVAASLVAYAASGQLGFQLSLDPNEVNFALNMAAHALISKLKPREKAPEAVAPELPKP